METVIVNVRDMNESDRPVLERIVGHDLREDQRVEIHVTEAAPASEGVQNDARPRQTIEDWTSIYEGLSDEEVEAIDQIIKTRANLTRYLP